jgi:hypothetical protein
MSDSKSKTKRIGFSTGALEKGDFKSAIKWLCREKVQRVELSALRLEELEPMVKSLESVSLYRFQYVSFHAPSSFPKEAERQVVRLLESVASRGWNIVVHPDVIRKHSLWKRFGAQLLIENMDRRKSTGRTVGELEKIFNLLPNARLCLDVAHARQLDTTLNLLSHLISQFSSKIAQIHISELDSWCQHQPMSLGAVSDYKKLAKNVRSSIPVIIESMLYHNNIQHNYSRIRLDEFYLAWEAMQPFGTGNDTLKRFSKKRSELSMISLFERHPRGTRKRKRLDLADSDAF